MMLPLLASITVAQTVQQSDLENCMNLETAELKLACFEAVVEAGRTTARQAAEVSGTVAVSSQPAAEIHAAADTPKLASQSAAEVSGAVETAKPLAAEVPDAANSAQAPANMATAATVSAATASQQSTAAPPATAAGTAEVVADTAENFGQEHLAGTTAKNEEVTIRATVVEVTKGSFDTLFFHLSNGHVWRQVEPRHFPYPRSGEFEIDITRGMMGDYRLRIGDKGRMVAIRRVE